MADEIETLEKEHSSEKIILNGEDGELSASDEVIKVKSLASDVVTDASKMDSEDAAVNLESTKPAKTEQNSLDENVEMTEAPPLKDVRASKRKASRSPEPVSQEEDFEGFDESSTPDYVDSKRILSSLIKKLESELQELEVSPAKVSAPVTKPLVRRPRVGTPTDHLISRPSSGLSIRSESELVASSSADVTSSSASSPASGRGKRSLGGPDLASPAFRLPLERGWKRELVYRGTLDQHSRRQADIYYYTPQGKKLRSSREISDYLSGTGLTMDNFTFFKEPLGLDDPEKEIIRDAKIRRVESPQPTAAPSPSVSAGPPRAEGKRTPKPKAPKGASPDYLSSSASKLKVKSQGSRLAGSDTDSPKAPRKSVSATSNATPPPTAKSTPAAWKKPRGGTGSATQAVPPPPPLKYGPALACNAPKMPLVMQAPCSVHCQGAEGQVPTLVCAVCLCLYHQHCTGFNPAPHDTHATFVCKNCKPQQGPPPLTHVSEMKPTQAKYFSNNPPIPCAPKLIPKPIRAPAPPKNIPFPRLTPVRRVFVRPEPKLATPPPLMLKTATRLQMPPPLQKMPPPAPTEVSQKRVVMKMKRKSFDNVTGKPQWTVQTNETPATAKPQISTFFINPMDLPQSIAMINGRKFIVVPQSSIASLGSAVAAMRSAPSQTTTTESAAKVAPKNIQAAKGPGFTKDFGGYNVKEEAFDKAETSAENYGDSGSVADIKMEYSMEKDTSGSSTDISQIEVREMFSFDSSESNEPFSVEDSPSLKKKAKGSTSTGQKSVANGSTSATDSPKKRGRHSSGGKSGEAAEANVTNDGIDHFSEFYKKSEDKGQDLMIRIFQYLKMREVASCARVCRQWRKLAASPLLWRHVRMKNSQVNDWGVLCGLMKARGTRTLDLRKMLLPTTDAGYWEQFSKHIVQVDSLERVDLCRCPAAAVERLCESHPQLTGLNALAVRCSRLDPAPLAKLTGLSELRIKSMAGLTLKSDLSPLKSLTSLKHLSLTSIKELGAASCSVVGELTQLESLELGECTFGADFGPAVLQRLVALERLRLERGAAECAAPRLLRALSQLPRLKQLELVNFDVKPGFDDALALCLNIKKLLIIPTYVSQSATTNRQVLSGVLRLKDTLSHLMWGVTIELLRVTELFIDQCEKQRTDKRMINSSNIGECIPVLKPVPGIHAVLDADTEASESPVNGPPQVEIMPLPSLQKLLNASLPHTKLKVLRIPFHATWRQSLADFQ